ncbi:MAG: site-specific integrase [Clostridiales Family XIII bacterium]|jgi:integrase|nr:site-specific integrase [Clostridiales Family XIII bacterium]
MPAYKDENTGKWYASFYFTNWKGVKEKKLKRGFTIKREALQWEREFLQQKNADLTMSFSAFVKVYMDDMKNRIREHTWQTKISIIESKLLPYFGEKKMCEIAPKDIIKWQNEMMDYRDKNGKGFSATYLKTLHNQISAIMNHAVRFYDLKNNPAAKAGSVGKKEAKEMLFWTKDEYLKFADSMMDKPLSFYAFEVLYWCGVRLGEMLALTPTDFDFEKNTVSVTKSYQRLKGKDVITDPKTPKSKRVIQIPEFLGSEIQEYIKSLYECASTDRLFPVTKSYLHHEMDRGSKASGVKRIRIHDIRHSHVSLLIEMGFSAVAIADRVGHESIDITYRYAHLFPSKQIEIADKLNIERGGF